MLDFALCHSRHCCLQCSECYKIARSYIYNFYNITFQRHNISIQFCRFFVCFNVEFIKQILNPNHYMHIRISYLKQKQEQYRFLHMALVESLSSSAVPDAKFLDAYNALLTYDRTSKCLKIKRQYEVDTFCFVGFCLHIMYC